MAVTAFGETNVAPKIELKDQYDKTQVVEFPRAKVSVLTIADRLGSCQLAAWVKPIRDQFGERVEIFGLADVTGVPGLIRPMVSGYFKDKIQYPVMLDWDGKVVASYGYVRKEALLLVIDRNGRIRLRETGAANDAKLAAVIALLQAEEKDSFRPATHDESGKP